MNRWITTLFCFGVFYLSGQSYNRPVPSGVTPYEFTRYDTSDHEYYLTVPFGIGPGLANLPKSAMILDANGYLVWYTILSAPNLLDFKYHPAYQRYSFIHYLSPQDIRFTLMDSDFQLVDSFTTSNGIDPDLHEFQITSHGTYLLSGIRDSVMDLSAYTFNGIAGSAQTHATGFVVQEFDTAHQLLFQWNSNDHIHPSEAFDIYGYSPASFDYAHGNAIWENTDGSLLVSLRNTNGIYKISRQTGQVAWILGGKSSSFVFDNDPGFSAQHDVRQLPNGNITLFDNANMAAPLKISRAVEYQLDTVNWIAAKVWEYKYVPGFFSPAMGNHQTTADRHHLINYGLNFRPNPSFVLTDDTGNLLSKLSFQDSMVSYRSFIFDLPLDETQRPVITCMQNGNSLTLFAPEGYARYAWSTGESGPSIVVDQPGTYQVWVNHGIGMFGSLPYVFDNQTNTCASVGTNTPQSIENRIITGYFDLLGRQIPHPLKGGIYIVRYANGAARLMMQIE